jgi:hypothetical protein
MPMMTDYRASACHGVQPGITLSAFYNHTADWRYLKTGAVILIREKPAKDAVGSGREGQFRSMRTVPDKAALRKRPRIHRGVAR